MREGLLYRRLRRERSKRKQEKKRNLSRRTAIEGLCERGKKEKVSSSSAIVDYCRAVQFVKGTDRAHKNAEQQE